MLNEQRPEKPAIGDGASLQVNSIFYTIQGEGPFAGEPAVFIRLAGCNLQCPLCDTEYTGRNTFHIRTISQLVSEKYAAVAEGAFYKGKRPLVVITGGEPFRQKLRPLIAELWAKGFQVQIETNGTLFQELDWSLVTVICSPKTGKINEQLEPHIAAYKYVIKKGDMDPDDGLPLSALDHPNSGKLAKPAFKDRVIYIQPADEKDITRNRNNNSQAVESCMRFGHTLGYQIHKSIGVD